LLAVTWIAGWHELPASAAPAPSARITDHRHRFNSFTRGGGVGSAATSSARHADRPFGHPARGYAKELQKPPEIGPALAVGVVEG